MAHEGEGAKDALVFLALRGPENVEREFTRDFRLRLEIGRQPALEVRPDRAVPAIRSAGDIAAIVPFPADRFALEARITPAEKQVAVNRNARFHALVDGFFGYVAGKADQAEADDRQHAENHRRKKHKPEEPPEHDFKSLDGLSNDRVNGLISNVRRNAKRRQQAADEQQQRRHRPVDDAHVGPNFIFRLQWKKPLGWEEEDEQKSKEDPENFPAHGFQKTEFG